MKLVFKDKLKLEIKRERTPEGYLKATAAITTVGIQEYLGIELFDVDPSLDPGKLYRVFRPAETVFHPTTVSTVKLKPITMEHHGDVDVSNHGDLSRGVVGETVEALDDMRLGAVVQLTDAGTIEDVESGKSEVSLGYECEIVSSTGEFDGKAYEFEFSGGMECNHLAVVPAGRCGDTVRILDGEDTLNKKALKATLKKMKWSDAAITARMKTLDGVGDEDKLTAAQVSKVFAKDQEGEMPPMEEMPMDMGEMMPMMMEMMMGDPDMMKAMAMKVMEMMKDPEYMDGMYKEMMDRMGKEADAEAGDDPDKEGMEDGAPSKLTDAEVAAKINDAAAARVAILKACDGLLPADFKAENATNKEVMVKALTPVMDHDISGESEDALRGMLSMLDADRVKAAKLIKDAGEKKVTADDGNPAEYATARGMKREDRKS